MNTSTTESSCTIPSFVSTILFKVPPAGMEDVEKKVKTAKRVEVVLRENIFTWLGREKQSGTGFYLY